MLTGNKFKAVAPWYRIGVEELHELLQNRLNLLRQRDRFAIGAVVEHLGQATYEFEELFVSQANVLLQMPSIGLVCDSLLGVNEGLEDLTRCHVKRGQRLLREERLASLEGHGPRAFMIPIQARVPIVQDV